MKKGWKIVKLPDLAKSIFAGGDVDKNNLSEVKTEEYPYPIYTNGETNDGLYGYTSIFRVNEPAITVSARGTIGFTCLRKEPYYPAVRLINIIPKENVNINYLNYFIKSKTVTSSGSSIPQLTVPMVKEFEIGIPESLEEQQTIVAKLDEVFAAIDQAKANIEKNIANAKELFQSKLNQIFSQKGEGWEEKMIIELCKHKSQIVGGPFGSNLKVSDYKESGIPILRLQNIGKGYFIDKDIKYISEEKAEELSYHSFKSGDIVLAKLGIPIGKTCMVPEDFDYGIVVADVVRIRPNIDEINYDFLKHFLNSDNAVSQLTADIKGATRPRVNIDEVRNLKLSIPSLSIQIKIVEEIDNLEKLRNELITKYQQKLANLEELKKSILEKAFKGELV